jgi:phage terminase large subunit-like protein
MVALPRQYHSRPVVPVGVYPKQTAYLRSLAWCRGFVAGRGAGKSYVGALAILREAKAGDAYMAVSPTFGDVEETTFPMFCEQAQKYERFIGSTKGPSYRVKFRAPKKDGSGFGTANIVFKSGEVPDRLRGPSKIGLWLDEASLMKPEVLKWGAGLLRQRGAMGRLMMTFTPKGRRHWSYEHFYIVNDGSDELRLKLKLAVDKWANSTDPQATAKLSEALRMQAEFEAGSDILKPNRFLVRARSSDNPFLPPEFDELNRDLYSSQLAARELDGEFVEIEGLMFDRLWFFGDGKRIDYAALPGDLALCRYWDKAGTDGGGCATATVLMGHQKSTKLWFVIDAEEQHLSAFKREQWIDDVAKNDAETYGKNAVAGFIEQEPGSGGLESAENTLRRLAPYNYRKDKVQGDGTKTKDGDKRPNGAKISRAEGFAAAAEAGLVRIVRGPWNLTYVDRLCGFPESPQMDLVDATSGAFNSLLYHVLPHRGTGISANVKTNRRTERHGVKLDRGRDE